MKKQQSGFTLIELIVVIVILGILSAVALPKFFDFGADARVASLNAAKGSLAATASMAHGKYLVAATPPTTINVEGQTVTFIAASGYPQGDAEFAAAAGLSADYTLVAGGSAATSTTPGVAATTDIALIPNSVAGTAKGLTCYVKYAAPTAANTAPVITVNGTTSNC